MADRENHAVSFNASLILPKLNTNSSGFRFEYSWKSAPDLSPSLGRKNIECREQNNLGMRNQVHIRTQLPNATIVETLKPGWIVRKSSSGYSSEEHSPYLAATLTLTSSTPNQDNELVRRTPQPYDRRCRSTCSITLENSAPVDNSKEDLNFPLKPRRFSESEAWDSHAALPRLINQKEINNPAAEAAYEMAEKKGPFSPSSATSSVTSKAKKKRSTRKDSRPRTVHIDVYCTASETETSTDNSTDTDESTTSSCYTVVRTDQTKIRHTKKKHGLPFNLRRNELSQNNSMKKPVLSYRISAKELAHAIERSRNGSGSIQTSLEEELFRDLTVTDSSLLCADSESESNLPSCDSFDFDDGASKIRNWRSPEDERKKRMLEQRKQQWRAAKALETSSNRSSHVTKASSSDRSTSKGNSELSTANSSQRLNTTRESSPYISSTDRSFNHEELMAKLKRNVSDSGRRSGSEKLTRKISQRCPNADPKSEQMKQNPQSCSNHQSNRSDVSFTQNKISQILDSSELKRTRSLESPKQCMDPTSVSKISGLVLSSREHTKNYDAAPPQSNPIGGTGFKSNVSHIAEQASKIASGATCRGVPKKLGHHIGPSRNPNCSCMHCSEYFGRC